jgi:hypothetical protein
MQAPRDDLDAFRTCRRACLAAVRHALDDDGPHLDDAQLGLLLDGAEVCETSIRFRRRNSTLHPRVCAVCVELCERCAELCDRFADDAVMRTCRDACRHCANVCRRLAGDPGADDTPEAGHGRPADNGHAVDGAPEDSARRASV